MVSCMAISAGELPVRAALVGQVAKVRLDCSPCEEIDTAGGAGFSCTLQTTFHTSLNEGKSVHGA